MIHRSDELLSAIHRRYRAGETIANIARDLGWSRSSMQREISSAGLARRQGPPLMPVTVEIPHGGAARGYLAGMFDGEGNIYWRRKTGRANSVRLTIYSTDAPLIEWFASIGGFVRWDHKRVERNGWKPCGRWEVNRTADVVAILRAIRPYLIVKRPLADEVLAFLTRKPTA